MDAADLEQIHTVERLGTLCAVQEVVYNLTSEYKESPVLGVLIDWLDATIGLQRAFLGRAYRFELEAEYGGQGSLENVEKRAAEVSSGEDRDRSTG